MGSFKNLIVWQKAFRLVIEIYSVTKLFPREELYGLVSQMRRASVTIVSNVAEGYVRQSTKEYIQFLRIAVSSSAELETQLMLSKELNFISPKDFERIDALLVEVMKLLNTFLRTLNSKL